MPFQAKEREGMLTGWIAGRIFWQLECINLPVERPQPLLELGLVDIFGVLCEQRGTRQLQRPQGLFLEGRGHAWPLGTSGEHQASSMLPAGHFGLGCRRTKVEVWQPECPSTWIEGMVPQVDLVHEDISSSLAFGSGEGILSPPS